MNNAVFSFQYFDGSWWNEVIIAVMYGTYDQCFIFLDECIFKMKCNMKKITAICRKKNNIWLGKIEEHPEIMTQSETVDT